MTRAMRPLPLAVVVVIIALTLAWLSSGTTSAATYQVDTTSDNSGLTACTPAPNDCSLRGAIIAANATPAVPDTITLPAGTYVIGGSRGDDTATTGDLDVTCTSAGCSSSAPLTINGGGAVAADTVIDAGYSDRIFDLATAQSNVTTLNLTKLTVRNGNPGNLNGGGIRVGNSDTVNLTNVIIADSVSGLSGGGISNSGNLTLTNSAVTGNSATTSGGGILHGAPGNLTVQSSTINGNYAGGGGGGGLDNKHSATLTNVTISDNSTAGPGGGILHSGLGTIYLNLINVTIADNSASSASGLRHDDPAGAMNTILANNPATNCSGATPLANWGGDVETGSTCGFALSNANPNLEPLADNGGPTLTRELLPGSQAINVGTGCPPPSTDQRGFPRPEGPACDSGAYEYGAAAPTPTPSPTPTPLPTPLPNSDNDGDGWTYASENLIGTDPADACGGPNAWPADLISQGTSTNKLDISDLAGFIAPLRRLGTSPGHPNYDPRWDIVPGAAFDAHINLIDLAALLSGATAYPPMFGGARAYGQTCSP